MTKQDAEHNKEHKNTSKQQKDKYQNNSDSEQSETEAESLTEFEVSESLLKEIASLLNTIISESKKNKLNTKEISPFNNKHSPKISLFDYLLRIQKYSGIENNTLIIALIYIDRICYKKGIILNKYNIHKILFSSILIAIKYNEDKIYDNLFFSKIAGISVAELKILEQTFLKIINYELFVSDGLYKKYYNSLNNDIVGNE